MVLNPRQRIEMVLKHKIPDRVPIGEMVQNYNVIAHYVGKMESSDGGWTYEEVCKACEKFLDFVQDPATSLKPGIRVKHGITYQSNTWTEFVLDRPFKELEGLKKWVKDIILEIKKSNPRTQWSFAGSTGQWGIDSTDYRGVLAKRQKLLGGSDSCVTMHNTSPIGLDTCYLLAGYELFSYLMIDDYGLLIEWFDVLNQHEVNRVKLVGDLELSPIVTIYCDIASNTGLMFSPNFLVKEFIPRTKRLVDTWHEKGVGVLFHSEGKLIKILDDLVKTGIDGINPLEPYNLSLETVRKLYPNLILWGGINDNKVLCFGTHYEVEQAVKDAIKVAGSNGNYFLASSGQIHPATKVENVVAMIDFAHKYGKY